MVQRDNLFLVGIAIGGLGGFIVGSLLTSQAMPQILEWSRKLIAQVLGREEGVEFELLSQ